jgi:hypothetical protein
VTRLIGGSAEPAMAQHRIEVIDRAYAAILAAKTPAERVALLVDCERSTRLLLAAGERLRHPDWTEDQIAAAVAKRIMDGAD